MTKCKNKHTFIEKLLASAICLSIFYCIQNVFTFLRIDTSVFFLTSQLMFTVWILYIFNHKLQLSKQSNDFMAMIHDSYLYMISKQFHSKQKSNINVCLHTIRLLLLLSLLFLYISVY